MNKIGERFKERRVKISKRLIKSLIYNIKGGRSFKALSHELGISYYTIMHDWFVKGNTIPISIFKKIVRLNPKISFNKLRKEIKILEPFWGQKLGGSRYKPFSLPNKITKEFAEFYGVMLGDGCIYSNLNGLCVSGDKILDKDYYNYLSKLTFNLFKIKPKILESKKDRTIRLILYSHPVSEYLLKMGFPKGKKLDYKLKIPDFILKNKNLTAYCIRGLVDTDGSISSHPHTKIMIHISIVSDSLRSSIYSAFGSLGLKVGKYNKGIVFYGKEKLNKFFRIIGSSNPKNIIKYKQFLRTNTTPTSKETEMFLRDKKI